MPPQPRIAVIGAGHWGRNHVRVMHRLGALAAVIDADPTARNTAASASGGVPAHASLDSLKDADIDGVVIASPATTHEPLALAALARGWHVLVEKPAAQDAAGVRRIAAAAAAANRTFAVGHLLLHHPHIQKARELIAQGAIGQPIYIYGQRVNLGRVRTDEDVISSLAPHDFSVAHYLLGGPLARSASAWTITKAGKPRPLCDVAFVGIEYDNGVRAHFHFSWLDPFKRRELVVVGTEAMLVFDDMQPVEKLRLYDKAIASTKPSHDFQEFHSAIETRDRGHSVPEVTPAEPLERQAQNFLACVATGRPPLAGPDSALAVAQAMELVRAEVR